MDHPQNTKTSPIIVNDLLETILKLRSPEGCPWDKEQTHQSLRKYLHEEAYEVLEVLDRPQEAQSSKKWNQDLKDELGDLLLQILLHCQIASERGQFSFNDVAQNLNKKLIRRHPHVFTESAESITTSEQVIKQWEKIKSTEKKSADSNQKPSVLDKIPKELSSLGRTQKIIDKVTRAGFQWPTLEGPTQKLKEEIAELEQELSPHLLSTDPENITHPARSRILDELGDVFFCATNIAAKLNMDAEAVLRQNITKFERRFRQMEKLTELRGQGMEKSTLEQMDIFWSLAKDLEYLDLLLLTGPIAAGKSKVRDWFANHGALTIDADSTVAQAYHLPEVQSQLQKRLGIKSKDEAKTLLETQPKHLAELEEILHPAVIKVQEDMIYAEAKKACQMRTRKLVVIEAALYHRSREPRTIEITNTLVIDADEKIRKQRLTKLRGLPPVMADQWIERQRDFKFQEIPGATLILNNQNEETLFDQTKSFAIENFPITIIA